MSRALTLALLLLLPRAANAQGMPGTNLTVDIQVVAVSSRGDTTRVEYILSNRSDSREKLFAFTVDAPARVLSISRPQPQRSWLPGTDYRGRSVAEWAALGAVMIPGRSSPTLWFEAVGVPGLVSAWIQGYVPPPPLSAADTNPFARAPDPLAEHSIRSMTVGVVPKPTDMSSAALVGRLQELRAQACGEMEWISSRGVCNSLGVKLDNAANSLTAGRSQAAAGQLRAFAEELDGQRGAEPGKHVNDSAYWLLKVNAEYILARI